MYIPRTVDGLARVVVVIFVVVAVVVSVSDMWGRMFALKLGYYYSAATRGLCGNSYEKTRTDADDFHKLCSN